MDQDRQLMKHFTHRSTSEASTMPHDGPVVTDNNDGSIVVKYLPLIQGKHEVLISHNDAPIKVNFADHRDTELYAPFQCIVDQVDGGYITAYGQGLGTGRSGEECVFHVVMKNGTASNLEVKVEGPTKVEVKRQDTKDGATTCRFLPLTPGAYNVHIKYKGKAIKGSPFSAKVSGEGRKRSQISLGASAEFSLGVSEADIVNLVGSLKTPAGDVEPCILKKLANGELGVAPFSPKEKGVYEVSVKRKDKDIARSPFKVNAGDKEVAHATKVKVAGKGLTEPFANIPNILTIDTGVSGYGGLSVVIEGQHRSDIELIDVKERVYNVKYSPHEPGIYIINVRFAEDHVPGSPYVVQVSGQPSGRIRQTAKKEMAAPLAITPNTNCEFYLKLHGTNPFDMEASLTDPRGTTELCEVMDEDDSRYKVKFTPKIKGVHILGVKHKSLHVAGSPFTYTVGALLPQGAHKVQVGGPGLDRGEVGKKNEFNVYSREAGKGDLSIAIEGPSTDTKITFEDRTAGFAGVCFECDKPGPHGLHIKWGDEHIPGSPLIVNVAPDSGDARLVSIHALRDRGLEINKPATFQISFNGAQGELHALVWTPSGAREDCFVQEMDSGEYAVRFVPKENGVHYVHLLLNDAHIPDSPFAVMVGSLAADPAMVHAYGDGIDQAKTGQRNKFIVRTASAGSGTLALFIDGPSKVALSCKEVDDGYEFYYTPFSAGKYLISLKYGNIPIAGSPFAVVATGAGRKASPIVEQSGMVVETVEKKPGAGGPKKTFTGDASKVVAKGAGLKKLFTNRVLNFTVDFKDAGNAMLAVGMISPKGLPEPELTVKKTGNTVYTVSYKVAEQGEHYLSVKWGDDDIPGSPFVLTT